MSVYVLAAQLAVFVVCIIAGWGNALVAICLCLYYPFLVLYRWLAPQDDFGIVFFVFFVPAGVVYYTLIVGVGLAAYHRVKTGSWRDLPRARLRLTIGQVLIITAVIAVVLSFLKVLDSVVKTREERAGRISSSRQAHDRF